MLVRIIDAEGDDDLVEKRHLGQGSPAGAQIGGGMEHNLIAAGSHLVALHERRIDPAVIIRHHRQQLHTRLAVKTVEVDAKPGRGTAGCGVENMRRQAAHHGPPFLLSGCAARSCRSGLPMCPRRSFPMRTHNPVSLPIIYCKGKQN
ncbi:MAG: hypothetical protein CM15mP115_16940 [Alphaproteobacteria bacterium]|nr:MAG: hypothetical protein CM15mP115_16940 [Alphaproteobacteria bacterium]